MFKKVSKGYKILFVLAVAWCLISVLMFIVGSILDMPIAKFFSDMQDNGAISWFSMFYDKLGILLIAPLIFISLAIIVESLHFKYKDVNNKSKCLMLVFYIGYPIIYSIIAGIMMYFTYTLDNGFTAGYDYWFGLDKYQAQIAYGIIFFIQTVITSVATWFFRCKFSKRNDLLIENYWIDAIKTIAVWGLLELAVGIMKIIWARPFYVNVNRVEIYNNLPTWFQGLAHTPIWGNGDPNGIQNAHFYQWWEPQSFTADFWQTLFNGDDQGKAYSDFAFPSGHVNCAFAVVTWIYLLTLGTKKNRKFNAIKVTLLLLAFINYILMGLAELISRTHWLTDLAFSSIFDVSMPIFICITTDKIIHKVLIHIWNKQGKDIKYNELVLNNKVYVNVVVNDIEWNILKIKKTEDYKNNKKYIKYIK